MRRGMTRNYNCKFSLSLLCSHFFLRELTSVLWVKWAREEKKREPRKSFFAGFELLCNHWNASRGGICLSIGRENGIGLLLLLLLLFLSFPCLEIEGRRRKRISFSFLSEWRREEEEGEVTSPFDIHKKVPSSSPLFSSLYETGRRYGIFQTEMAKKSRSYSSRKKNPKLLYFLFKCRYCICKFIRGKPGPFPKRDLSSSCICILTHCIPYRPPIHSHSHSNSLSSPRETGKGTETPNLNCQVFKVLF